MCHGVEVLWDLLRKVYEKEKIPDEWRDSVIIPIYKEKGDIQDCGNYRGIKLMSHTMKIWERVVEGRIRQETDIGEQQFGFMPGRGTTDAIFAVRQMLEKYGEKQRKLHLVFIDLEKAYDRLPREEVWRCLREKGVSEKYVKLVKDMYEGARTQVRTSVGLMEKFTVTFGLLKTIYSVFSLLTLSPLSSIALLHLSSFCSTPSLVVSMRTMSSANNMSQGAGSMIPWPSTSIITSKMYGLREEPWCGEEEMGDVTLFNDKLKRVNTFKYLGSYVASNGTLDFEISHRIQSGWRNWKNA
ncbi:uncharacterized protein LOC106469594 [Limulus polyphemus]|uniref:Uncharacterized protein LOC106469594 n=1 Tax=Limulus polyphemus TaxID=6850 RepID=A0ABM1BNH4_LIMPO|nr:uncharacterized protein LOC106469594 [Limulus polyphemus]